VIRGFIRSLARAFQRWAIVARNRRRFDRLRGRYD
jgi:hypothetical protein